MAQRLRLYVPSDEEVDDRPDPDVTVRLGDLLPLAAMALLIYWVVQMWREVELRAVAAHYVLMCSTLSGLLLSVVIGRADIIHFMYLMPLFALVLG